MSTVATLNESNVRPASRSVFGTLKDGLMLRQFCRMLREIDDESVLLLSGCDNSRPNFNVSMMLSCDQLCQYTGLDSGVAGGKIIAPHHKSFRLHVYS